MQVILLGFISSPAVILIVRQKYFNYTFSQRRIEGNKFIQELSFTLPVIISKAEKHRAFKICHDIYKTKILKKTYFKSYISEQSDILPN